MADLSITAANVAKGTDSTTITGTAGATITAGQSVYLDSFDSRYKLSDANAAGTGRCDGIALNGAAAGQPLTVLISGNITIGATVAVGTIYCVSAGTGAICPLADLLSGEYIAKIGIATTAAIISVKIHNSGVAKA